MKVIVVVPPAVKELAAALTITVGAVVSFDPPTATEGSSMTMSTDSPDSNAVSISSAFATSTTTAWIESEICWANSLVESTGAIASNVAVAVSRTFARLADALKVVMIEVTVSAAICWIAVPAACACSTAS